MHELWIEQARFLAENRAGPSAGVRFEVCDLHDLPHRDIGRFDVTIFSGIRYHLADPIAGLKIAAEHASELVYVSGATQSGFPDGALIAGDEPVGPPHSGVHGLQWFPTGPMAIQKVLAWQEFGESRTVNWWNPDTSRAELDCVMVIAARSAGALKAFDAFPLNPEARLAELARALIPPRATVLVAGTGDELQLSDRRVWCFPQDDVGAPDEAMRRDERGSIRQLDALRVAGAEYLLVPRSQSEWFEAGALRDYVELRFDVYSRDESCVIYDLTG